MTPTAKVAVISNKAFLPGMRLPPNSDIQPLLFFEAYSP
jgi:hypothetical protein